jgi:very-short-patch-repair endonuclease
VDEIQAEGEAELSQLEETLLHQMQLVGLPTPEREYRFSPPRRYRADFAYPERKLLIEVEGGVWTRGRHTRGAGYTSDAEKYNLATVKGWRVLRFTGDMIKNGSAIDTIEKVLNDK